MLRFDVAPAPRRPRGLGRWAGVAVTLAWLVCISGPALAMGPGDGFELTELVMPRTADGSGSSASPRSVSLKGAISRLLWEIDKRTSIDAAATPSQVRLSDPGALPAHPLLYLPAGAPLLPPGEGELTSLRAHLQRDSMLLVDGTVDAAFDASFQALLARMFPGRPLERLAADHVVYRSFYLLAAPVGRIATTPFLEGIVLDGRVAVLYSRNDLAGAWARSDLGQWENDVIPGGEAQREMAFRLGINIAMYALCLEYKSDQVHVPFILRRRHWQSQ